MIQFCFLGVQAPDIQLSSFYLESTLRFAKKNFYNGLIVFQINGALFSSLAPLKSSHKQFSTEVILAAHSAVKKNK